MARQLRIEFPGAIHHVTVRGNGRRDIFLDDRDRERFLLRLSESVESYEVRLYLFCLMSNHYHLLVETPKANISRFMQSLETGHTVYFNLRHGRSGHLTQGRFGSKLVESQKPEDIAFRKVALNLSDSAVLQVVSDELGLNKEDLLRHRRGSLNRALAAAMLWKYCGLTKRAVAAALGRGSGTAVSWQLRKLDEARRDRNICPLIRKMEKKLDALRKEKLSQ